MTLVQNFDGPTQVLGFIANKVALGAVIGDTGVTADATGKKIIPAGTPVGGADSTLDNEQAVLTVVNDATAQGVLEFPVDVTAGQNDGTLIVNGYINANRLPQGVTISDDVKKALAGKVVFFKRNK
ncbi:hypothetical protein FD12_GL001401 [Lentilactobacillus rapi DSM 19907 = JCM 15042]|uniref:Uncharacterized protein n=2 Tax=Lentilactobacillus rapi TaxID=481723 RepID=A0ABR5PFF9_9LACO|nr:hypothetical protein [Lentilactobacillus rapi]KRL17872.1 hypothetical protein FD12_GL001401 [Lentilactobacillus rapi DSM 19907 = JCM 15042]GEP72023.1 putative structural protein - phage associated [Lentilactobacillus rapi]